jgi:hypothetical protein
MTNKYIDRILKFSENDFISLACKDRKNDVFHSNMTNDGKHRSLGLLRKTDYCNYISLNLFKDKNRTKSNIKNLNGFMLDFDEGNISELVENFESIFGKATWKIRTTPSKGKTQLIYLFKDKENRIDIAEKVSFTITRFGKGDTNTWDLPRMFRHPESVNGKNGELTTVIDSGVEYSLDYFIEKLKDNSIGILLPPNNSYSNNQKKNGKVNSIRKKVPVNSSSNYYSEYSRFEISKPSPSEARYSFIQSLVRKRKNDNEITSICNGLNLDEYDCKRILNKIRSGYKLN